MHIFSWFDYNMMV